jgi:Cu/Ag efflux pump CusA
MIAGMVPMAFGIGEGSQQTAPLSRAVIGGLLFATAATLLILPVVFSLVQRRAGVQSPSLDPDDPASAFARARTGLPGETA